MAYERQRALRDELNQRYPKMKGNLGQQMFRAAYYNDRMSGLPHSKAHELSLAAVRQYEPGFVPVGLPG
jgi:hypothetical protein